MPSGVKTGALMPKGSPLDRNGLFGMADLLLVLHSRRKADFLPSVQHCTSVLVSDDADHVDHMTRIFRAF